LSNIISPEESELVPDEATTSSLGRGLPVVDTFLTLVRIQRSLPSGGLYLYNTQYSKRTIRRALTLLERAGYIIRVNNLYSTAPSVFVPPNRFIPPSKLGIAEVDLLLLVLSGIKRPRHIFITLWGGEMAAKRDYYNAVRRLLRFGYLERSSARQYRPGKRTVVLLKLNKQYNH